ncbi:MAG: hypothetical protein LBU36_01380, partial [Clostridiales bacterium]|nr:hypothetical protein [Clostridiales bacterium]
YRVRLLCVSSAVKYHKFGNKYMISEKTLLEYFGELNGWKNAETLTEYANPAVTAWTESRSSVQRQKMNTAVEEAAMMRLLSLPADFLMVTARGNSPTGRII